MAKEKKEKKSKKEKKDKGEAGAADADEGPDYDELCSRVNVISKPLATKKLSKKLFKGVGKAAKSKTLFRGVKEVGKALRKGKKGVVIIAGDISPIDVIAHMPVACEEAGVPYVYVPSKQHLGMAGLTKRPTSIVLVPDTDEDDHKEIVKEVEGLEE
eukprot:m.431150 g.431150  ORF g.431150 m.431150 type:complete len:157 (+) comp17264_c0_seq1:90-560(+)